MSTIYNMYNNSQVQVEIEIQTGVSCQKCNDVQIIIWNCILEAFYFIILIILPTGGGSCLMYLEGRCRGSHLYLLFWKVGIISSKLSKNWKISQSKNLIISNSGFTKIQNFETINKHLKKLAKNPRLLPTYYFIGYSDM